jgi:hypothetical protein
LAGNAAMLLAPLPDLWLLVASVSFASAKAKEA